MAQAQSSFDRVSAQFEVEWYEIVLQKNPDSLEVVDRLAHAYTALGMYPKGLAMDERLVAAMPTNALVHYNYACSLSLVGRPDESIDALLLAIELGYDEREHLMNDEDLEGARNHPRFSEVQSALRIDREEEEF